MGIPSEENPLACIRGEIERYGHSTVGCDQLLVLTPRGVPIRSQFAHIFAVAAEEGWSLEFRPDGTVRFAPLAADQKPPIESTFDQGTEEPILRTA